ncbi:(2Fe-2S)-binding protein [Sporolactobacillus sp. THM7-7]|nr:(2Fe-2S)-binding protein [Sporolactobacillus sp. THM7-7]
MPKVRLHVSERIVEKEVKDEANLVVMAALGQFPELKYGCGIGRCTKCKSKIIEGGEHLNPPNWKEKKLLGDELEEGYRLTCQLTITSNVELTQDEQLANRELSGEEAKM